MRCPRSLLVLAPALIAVLSVLACAPLHAAQPAAQDADSPDPLVGFPQLAKPQVQALAPPASTAELMPGSGIFVVRADAKGQGGAVVLPAVALIEQGPVDGLEVLLCLEGGKTHEAFARTPVGNAELLKAAFMAVLNLPQDGAGSEEASGLPARGFPVAVTVHWRDDTGAWRGIAGSSLVRDRRSDAAYPALPYVYTGSRLVKYDEAQPDGSRVAKQRFMLGATKSLVINYDEPDALLASPFPGAISDTHFEANSAITPPVGRDLRIVFTRAVLPLTLHASANGLSDTAGGTPLGDADIATRLAAVYGPGKDPAWRALAVQVDPALPRSEDRALRQRLLAAAVTAKAWVVPIFVP